MARAKAAPEQSTGAQIIAGLEAVVTAVEAGGLPEVQKRFTVRQVERDRFPRPVFLPADIAAIRAELGISQVVFAGLLGVALSTVRTWELGSSSPSGMARRFLAEIRGNAAYWRAKVIAATGTEIIVKSGAPAKPRVKKKRVRR